MNAWNPQELETMQSMWLDGKGSGQIAKVIGRTRNAVMGMINRQGLMGAKGRGMAEAEPRPAPSPKPTIRSQSHIDAERAEILKRDIAKIYFGEANEDDIEIIQILAAAVVFETVDPERLASLMAIDEEITTKVRDDMISAGLWTSNSPGDLQRYEGKEGYLQFILEAMLYEGLVKHGPTGWYRPDALEMPIFNQSGENVAAAIATR